MKISTYRCPKLTGLVGCEKQRLFSSCSSATPARPSAPGAEGLGTARFTKPLELQKRPRRRVCGRGCSSAPKPTTPTSQRRLTPLSKHTGPGSRLVSNMGHRSPHLRVLGAHFHRFYGHVLHAGQRAGRTPHAGQFSYFGPRSCLIAFVSEIHT
jgi:hypothetical protein